MSQFQYCDLRYDPVRAILEDTRNSKGVCDRREGWFVEGVIVQVRKTIKDRWLELVKEADARFYEQAMAMTIPAPQTISNRRSAGLAGGDLSQPTTHEAIGGERVTGQEEADDADVEEYPEYELYD